MIEDNYQFSGTPMAHRPAPFPSNEEERAQSLEQLRVLDSVSETVFDDVVRLATTLCEVPIALVSLVDRDRQWFKSCIGLEVQQTHRDLAFCAHAILNPTDVMVVEDATLDARFACSPLVKGPPYICFYAGAPIVTEAGHALGTVCVIDIRPRTLSEPQIAALQILARQAAALLDARFIQIQRDEQVAQLRNQLGQLSQSRDEAASQLDHSRRISSLGMLTASIAHDFNNLLQGVGTALEMIRLRSRRPMDVERFSKAGLEAVEHGRQLINYLMSSVRGDGPEVICIDVSARLQAVQSTIRNVVRRDITLTFDFAAWGWGVMCVEAQLQAVVINLLSNAQDAITGSGQIEILTRWQQVDDDFSLAAGDYLVLSVRDNGPGMCADTAVKAFEPFFTTKPAGEGTGLGLAQVKDFAIKAGGDARVVTLPGQGTTVSVYLRILGRVAAPTVV